MYNGSIIRAFPDAGPGDSRARMLLFANTANRHVRRNLTVRLSCDCGATWPVSRVVQSGASAYSTLTPLRGADGRLGGRYGLLYERDGYRHISFTSFGLDWLGCGCDARNARAGDAAVTADSALQQGAALVLRPVLDAIYLNEPAGLLGDRIQPWIEVINTGTAPLTDIAITATPATGACSLATLAPGATAVCHNNTPTRIITDTDLAAGSWAPVFRATAHAGAALIEASAPLFPVPLVERRKGERNEIPATRSPKQTSPRPFPFNCAFLEQVPQDLIDRRRAAGRPTLFYTWAEPRAPNTITATPLYCVRALPWVAAQRHLDGYLRWTYNSWPADVHRQPKFRYTQGDEYLVYPGARGPVSSIRWEVFRDGLEDAELIDLAAGARPVRPQCGRRRLPSVLRGRTRPRAGLRCSRSARA